MSTSTSADFYKTPPMLPLLPIDLKRAEQLDYKDPLTKYVAENYPGTNVSAKIDQLNLLRSNMVGAGKDVQGRDVIYKYYGQLELLELHFPIGTEECAVEYTWYECYKNEKITQNSIAYEKACVIFNLAAVLSHVAAQQNRQEENGLKTAFNYLQCSAGVFSFIRDNFLHSPSLDMSKEFINVLVNLMLAQAQECFVDKLILEDKKPQLIMKCSAQAAQFYQTAINSLDDKLKAYLPSSFKNYMDIKLKYFLSHSNLFWGIVNETKYGEIVARYGLSIAALKECTKLVQQESQGGLMNKLVKKQHSASSNTVTPIAVMEDLLTKFQGNFQVKYNSAVKDNDILYHEVVPQNISLSLSPAEKLVMAEPKKLMDTFPAIVQVVGGDLFEDLLPLSVHEQSSFYSEEKAKLLRNQSAVIEELNSDFEARLSSMKLKETLELLKTALKQKQGTIEVDLPSDIKAMSDHIRQEENRGQKLQANFESVKSESAKCDALIKEIKVLVKGQQAYENKLGVLENNYLAGTRGDTVLLEKYNKFSQDINLLISQGELLEEYKNYVSTSTIKPTDGISLLDMPVVDYTADVNVVIQIDTLLQELYKLKKERQAKVDNFKIKVLEDDISKLLVYNKSNESSVIQQQLQKFQPLILDMQENINLHSEKLKQLLMSFSKLTSSGSPLLKQIESEKKRRAEFTQRVNEAKVAFDDLKFNSQKGFEFYSGLMRSLNELKSKYMEFLSIAPIQPASTGFSSGSYLSSSSVSVSQQVQQPSPYTQPSAGPYLPSSSGSQQVQQSSLYTQPNPATGPNLSYSSYSASSGGSNVASPYSAALSSSAPPQSTYSQPNTFTSSAPSQQPTVYTQSFNPTQSGPYSQNPQSSFNSSYNSYAPPSSYNQQQPYYQNTYQPPTYNNSQYPSSAPTQQPQYNQPAVIPPTTPKLELPSQLTTSLSTITPISSSLQQPSTNYPPSSQQQQQQYPYPNYPYYQQNK